LILQTPSPHRYCFGDFTLDLEGGLLMRNGDVVPLRKKAFEVLTYLVERHGRLVTKNELIEAVWRDVSVTDNSLTQCLTEIRRVLEDDAQQLVRTVARRGYIFAAPVNEPAVVAPRTSEPVVLSARPNARLSREGPTAWYRRTWVWVAAALLLPVGLACSLLFRFIPPGTSSLAILPFHPLDQSGEQDFLGLGMTDSLITRLSLVRGLSVRPWASVQLYIRSEKDPVTLGHELRVESVVDGTLQRAGDRIRVTARLYRVDDGKLLWAEKFDEPYRDLLAVQDSISEKVAAALSLRLSRQPQPRVDPEAYEAYVRGRYFFELFTKEGNQRAKEYFERAIELEPDFALAHAGLALNYGPMRVRGFIGPLEHLEEHRDAAERALTLDDSLAEAHLAMFTFRLDTRDWQGAERSVKRAIELNPNYLHAWGFYAFLLHGLGRHEEGLAASQRALEIDPVSDYASKDLGNSLVRVGRYQEALEQAKKAVELRPDFAPAHQVLASAYAALNQLEDAYRHFQIAGDQVSAARIRARQGDMGPVRDLIEALEPRNAWMALAPLYLAMGDKERALSALESAYEAQSPMMHVAVDSRFQPLHGDPRFERVVSRLRLSTGD
jgi:DNA-binding winged helix-turn-helix (wHTH) protein/TolB-like protein/Tfp pilus assembly protein PilF